MQKILKAVAINFTDDGDFNGVNATYINVSRDDNGKINGVSWGLPEPISIDEVGNIAEYLGDGLSDIVAARDAMLAEIESLKTSEFNLSGEIDKLNRQIEEINILLRDAEESRDTAITQSQATEAELREQIDNIQQSSSAQIEALQRENEQLKEQLASAESDNSLLTQENDRIKSEVENSNSALEQAENRIVQLKSEIDGLREIINQQTTEEQ